MRVSAGAALGLGCIAIVVAPLVLPAFYVLLLTQAVLFGLFAFGLDLVWGRAGVVSIGHALFFGCSAYGVAIAVDRDVPAVLGAAAGIALALVLALAVASSGLRARATASSMAVLTLGATLLGGKLATAGGSVTNGTNGLFVAQPEYPATYAWICMAIAGATVLAIWQLVLRARVGNRLAAVRLNEQRAAELGIAPFPHRVLAFLLSAGVAALAGALAAPVLGLVSPAVIGIVLSTQVFVWLAIGGRASLVGPFLGALLVVFGQEALSDASEEYYALALGVVFVGVMVVAPDGIAGLWRRPGGEIVARRHRPRGRATVPAVPGAAALQVEGIVQRFGAATALDGISLTVRAGESVCLIGPNGAGKSTLLQVVGGQLSPDAGTVAILGHPCTRLAPHARARLGLGRSFQVPSLFAELTVREHFALAVQEADRVHPLPDAYRRFGDKLAEVQAGHLPPGERRSLEIAIAVAAGPRLLMLDEPTAGLTREEAREFARVLHEVQATLGCAIVTVEHDMEIVRTLAARVIVLHQGRVLAEGSMDAVSANPAVRHAYLGGADEREPHAARG